MVQAFGQHTEEDEHDEWAVGMWKDPPSYSYWVAIIAIYQWHRAPPKEQLTEIYTLHIDLF